jgi:hypothetical protein
MLTMSDIDQWRVPVLAIECEGQPDRESKSASAANEQADDQRGQGKDAQNATEYHHQPNAPATFVLDNLKGYIGQIGEVLPRHRTSLKPIEDRFLVCFGALLRA